MGCLISRLNREARYNIEEQQEQAETRELAEVPIWQTTPSLTTAQLERLRKEFWETRIEGRSEMWQAIKFAAEHGSSTSIANETLRAAGLRPASNSLSACYDERGHLYETPMYCMKDPENLDTEPSCSTYKQVLTAVEACMRGDEVGGVNTAWWLK